MPDADPHFAGVFTNGSIEAPLVEQADALIGVGLDPVEVIPRPWAYAQPVVDIAPYHVEADHVPFAAQRIGDVAAGVRRTAQRLTRSTWDLDAVRRFVDAQRRTIAATTTASAGRLAPHRVVELVAHAAPGNRVTVDAGAHMFPATLLWPVAEPNGMLISNGLSTMGFALPAAIGAALLERERVEAGRARHDRPVVALTGDGGLLMCAGELVTAVRERLRVVVVVFNDASLSLIDVKQQQRRLEPAGVRIGDVDWRALGESVGMRAHHAPTEAALVGAVADAMRQDGPTLIDVRIDAASYAPTLIAVRGG